MDGEAGYKPPPDFEEDKMESLIDLNLTDSTELWLIQWPLDNPVDFDGQQVSLKLHGDGCLGSFQGSSGKLYDVISYKSQNPEAMVFLSSASESKIAGRISRRVSLAHYPDPSELQKHNNLKMGRRSSTATSTMSGHHSGRYSQTVGGYVSSNPSSRTKSSLSGPGRPLKSRHEEPSKSIDLSAQDSRKGHSVLTSTETGEHSQERKSKKKRRIES